MVSVCLTQSSEYTTLPVMDGEMLLHVWLQFEATQSQDCQMVDGMFRSQCGARVWFEVAFYVSGVGCV